MEQNRWKSPVLWAAIVAQIVSILLMVGAFNSGVGDQVNQIAGAVLQLLVLLGIMNNPTDKLNF